MTGRKNRKPTGGGGARNPRSLANLRPQLAPAAPLRNARAVKHGAYAAVTAHELDGKTREIFDALGEDAPVREVDGALPAADTLVVRMLAEVMVRRERVRVTELRHGLETPDGRLRGVVEYGLRLDGQALELAKELGMTPRSRAALGLDLARAERVDLAQVWAAQHEQESAHTDAIDAEAEEIDPAHPTSQNRRSVP